MGIALWRVQKQIADPSPRNVLILWCHISKDKPAGDFYPGPFFSRPAKVGLPQLWEP